MFDVSYKRVIVPRDHFRPGDELGYGRQYAHEYMVKFQPERLAWLDQHAPGWDWYVTYTLDVADLPEIIVVPPNAPKTVDRLEMFVRFKNAQEAVLYRLTW